MSLVRSLLLLLGTAGTFAAAAAVAAPLTWSGSVNSSWSLVGSDANWRSSSGTAAFANGSVVTFSNSGTHTGITIASGGVQPASVARTNTTTSYSFSGGAISGSATVTLSGSGRVTFLNANTYTGATTISAGTLQLGNGTAGYDGSIAGNSIVNNGALVYDLTGSPTYSGTISGTGSLIKNGTGVLALAGNNNFSGTTSVAAGTLLVAQTGSLPGYATSGLVSAAAGPPWRSRPVVRASGLPRASATCWAPPH